MLGLERNGWKNNTVQPGKTAEYRKFEMLTQSGLVPLASARMVLPSG